MPTDEVTLRDDFFLTFVLRCVVSFIFLVKQDARITISLSVCVCVPEPLLCALELLLFRETGTERGGKILTPFSSLSCQFAYWKYNFWISRFSNLFCHRQPSLSSSSSSKRASPVRELFVVAMFGKLDLLFLKYIAAPPMLMDQGHTDARCEEMLAEESFKRHTYKFVY